MYAPYINTSQHIRADLKNSMPGPPLSNDTALVTLLRHGVTVGLGVQNAWEARNTRFDIQWVCDRILVDV
jgi:hypothetical protein